MRRVLGRAEQRKRCQGQLETLERLRGVKEQVQEEDDAFIAEVGDLKHDCCTIRFTSDQLLSSKQFLTYQVFPGLCRSKFYDTWSKVVTLYQLHQTFLGRFSLMNSHVLPFSLNKGLLRATLSQRPGEEDREGGGKMEERPTIIYI